MLMAMLLGLSEFCEYACICVYLCNHISTCHMNTCDSTEICIPFPNNG